MSRQRVVTPTALPRAGVFSGAHSPGDIEPLNTRSSPNSSPSQFSPSKKRVRRSPSKKEQFSKDVSSPMSPMTNLHTQTVMANAKLNIQKKELTNAKQIHRETVNLLMENKKLLSQEIQNERRTVKKTEELCRLTQQLLELTFQKEEKAKLTKSGSLLLKDVLRQPLERVFGGERNDEEIDTLLDEKLSSLERCLVPWSESCDELNNILEDTPLPMTSTTVFEDDEDMLDIPTSDSECTDKLRELLKPYDSKLVGIEDRLLRVTGEQEMGFEQLIDIEKHRRRLEEAKDVAHTEVIQRLNATQELHRHTMKHLIQVVDAQRKYEEQARMANQKYEEAKRLFDQHHKEYGRLEEEKNQLLDAREKAMQEFSVEKEQLSSQRKMVEEERQKLATRLSTVEKEKQTIEMEARRMKLEQERLRSIKSDRDKLQSEISDFKSRVSELERCKETQTKEVQDMIAKQRRLEAELRFRDQELEQARQGKGLPPPIKDTAKKLMYGSMTKEQALEKFYDCIDADGSGEISVMEFSTFCRKSSNPALRGSLVDSLRLFQQIDTDGSGDISKDEFVTALCRMDDGFVMSLVSDQMGSLAPPPPPMAAMMNRRGSSAQRAKHIDAMSKKIANKINASEKS